MKPTAAATLHTIDQPADNLPAHADNANLKVNKH
jgi:hypothetical protein